MNNNEQHHPWCNFYNRPRKGCEMCKRFFKLYPVFGVSNEQLAMRHFPDTIFRASNDK